jgi:hypothetical protein
VLPNLWGRAREIETLSELLEGKPITEIWNVLSTMLARLARRQKRLWWVSTDESFYGWRGDKIEERNFLLFANGNALVTEVHSKPVGGSSDDVIGHHRILLYSEDGTLDTLKYVKVEWVPGPGYTYYADEVYKVIAA